jgi:hypothetical protein
MSEQYRPERLRWLPVSIEMWEQWEESVGHELTQAEVLALLNMVMLGRLWISKP